MSAPPLTSQVILSFQQIGVDPQLADISNTALSQDKYLCISEVTDSDSYVVIVDLQNNNNVIRHKMKADTAVMHPSRDIIALRGASTIQIFDLNHKQRLNSFLLPDGQVVNYWKWIDEQTLAFVAGGSVFHWSIAGQSNPKQVFQLQPQLASGSILNYSVSHDQQWLAVSGLLVENDQQVGKVQVFSRERNISQVIDGYAASFANVQSIPLLIFASKANGTMRLNIFSLGTSQAAQQFGKKYADLPPSQDSQGYLPLHLIISPRYSTAFLITKYGYLYCVEIETPFVYISGRVSQTPLIHASLARDGSVIALAADGTMSKFGLNDANIIDYIATKLANPQAAAKVAAAGGGQISGDFMNHQFDQLLQMGNYAEAARIAANSPGGSLRNQATIEKIRRIPNRIGGPPPLLQYFMNILDTTKLNEVESIELCRIALAHNKTDLIEKWIKEDKLTPTEELGDLCKQDQRISLAIYLRANVSSKTAASYAELEMFDKLQSYCQKFDYEPDWMEIVTIIARQNPDKIGPILTHIANNGKPLVEPKALVQKLLQFQLFKAATSFLVDVLTQDREEDSELQTLLFEISLNNAPKLAEELFSRNCYTYYDRQRVASLCERAGNFQHALELYIDLPSIKRCIVNAHSIPQDFLIQYFDYMSPEWAIDCLRELLTSNPGGNVQLVVTIAGTYWKKLGIDNLINLFNETNSSNGIYYFLAQAVNTCDDPDIHFRYIEAAAKLGNFLEVENMCQESQHLQPERVRDYLIKQDLPDKIPLIVLCNRFGFVVDLTKFLYKKGYTRELETYVQKFNPKMAGRVIGTLIDIEAQQNYITKILHSVQEVAPIDAWAEIAKAQLAAGRVVDAIDSYVKAKDPKDYIQVIKAAKNQGEYKALVQYLQLVRQTNKSDPMIETELCYAYAKSNNLVEFEKFISSLNSAQIKEVSDRCKKENLSKACQILYNFNNVKSSFVPDEEKIEQSILQYLIQINDDESLSDIQKFNIFNSIISQNKQKLTKNWEKKEPKTTLQADFKILTIDDIQDMPKIEKIGQGATSEVYKIANGNYLALKTITIEDGDEEGSSSFEKMRNFLKEYEILNHIDHPNIIKAFGIFLGDESNRPSIVLEYCPTNLRKSMKSLTNIERVLIIYQISSAMSKVHSLNIIHRNLKPENILLDDHNQAKLSDFGLSKLMDSLTQTQTQMSIVETFNYLAPEIILEQTNYNEKVDVYSFGVIVYNILTYGKNPAIKMIEVSQGMKAKIPKNINKFSTDLISKCWNFDPAERPSFNDIANEIIKNKFQLIDGIDIDDPLIQKYLK